MEKRAYVARDIPVSGAISIYSVGSGSAKIIRYEFALVALCSICGHFSRTTARIVKHALTHINK